jgi:MGT family glycosyltransferase
MRILFATMPFDGHFNPLTAIAVHLRERGHDVAWYTGPSYQPKVAALGIQGFLYQRSLEVTGENVAELFPERAGLRGPKLISFEGDHIFSSPVEGHYRDIIEIHEQFPFDALFCDVAFFAAKLIGEKLPVRVYTVGVGPMLANSRDVPPPFFGLKPATSIVGRLVHRGVRAMVHSGLKAGVVRYNQLLTAEGIEPVTVDQWFDIPHECAHHCFQDGVPGLDYPRSDLPANISFVGPLIPHRTSPQEPLAITERLARNPSKVVVVSQGTVDNHDATKLIEPTLEALEDGPYQIVVTTGGRNTRTLRARYTQDNVVIEDFIDFDALFQHADVFVSNGGYGSVQLALRHGVPIVGAGTREGKNDINARLDHLRLGVDLRTERPKPKQVADGVAAVLADPAIARNVVRIRDELASYHPLEIIDRQLEHDTEHLAPKHPDSPHVPDTA